MPLPQDLQDRLLSFLALFGADRHRISMRIDEEGCA
jgi:hypothetical protein